MNRLNLKEVDTEVDCPACEGTGYPTVTQPIPPGRRSYPARCKQCFGKGRLARA
jgi:DnaJ-class molecular chaperone